MIPSAPPIDVEDAFPDDPIPSPNADDAFEIRRLAVVRRVVCARRSRRCRRPGVTLRIDLSAPATVRESLARRRRGSRRFRRAGRVSFGQVAAGPRRLRIVRVGRRKLRAGNYRLRVQVCELRRTLRFRVRA